MLKLRLKEMDLRLTEIADYLQISRPTLYKFIEYYDAKNFEMINKKILKLFNYVTENELVGRKNVINYILTNLVELKELDDSTTTKTIKNIKAFLVNNSESKKSKFLELVSSKNIFDEVIYYLVEIYPFINKKQITKEQEKLLIPYKELIKNIKNNSNTGGE